VIASLEQEVNELTSERDEAIRDKKTLEQDLLATNNRLKNKAEEVKSKEAEINQIKKEASEKDKTQQKKLKELKENLAKVEEKYRKREKLLDEEQCENNKLTEKIEQLQAEIAQLKK
jgi:chromosome segregation ATPase